MCLASSIDVSNGAQETQSVPSSTRPTDPEHSEAAPVQPDSGLLDPQHLAISNASAEQVQARTNPSAASDDAPQQVVCSDITSTHLVAIAGADISGTPSLGLPAEASSAFRVYANAIGAHALHLQPLPDGRCVPASLEGVQAGDLLFTEVPFYHCLAPDRLGHFCTTCLLPLGTMPELCFVRGVQFCQMLLVSG
jgi:hypothetical protein